MKKIEGLFIPFLVILVSFIYGLPNIILAAKLGSSYTPFAISSVSPIARDETYAYAPEANYILNGHFPLKEVYASEYSKYPTPFMGETAPSVVFALLAKLTGSLENAFVAADFIFPPMIFLLLFTISRLFIKNTLFASSVAFLSTVSRDFIAVIPFPHETIQYLTFAEGQNYLLDFSRAFHPQLTFIFFALALIIFIKMCQKPQDKKYIIFSGLAFGSLFYSYVFYWTYFAAFFVLIFLYFLATRQKPQVKALFLAGLIAFIVAIPYLYNMFLFYRLDLVGDFVAKSSLKNVPLPLTLIRYLALSILFFVFSKKRDNKFFIFLFFILAGILISPVSKWVLGQDLETFHYLRRALMPFATIALFVVVYYLLAARKSIVILLSIIIFVVFIPFAFNSQIIASGKIESAHVRNKDLMMVFNYLNKNTPEGSVVASPDTNFESLLPVYTANHAYFPPTDRTIMPTAEGVTRYAIVSNILGIDKSWQKDNLDNIVSYLFIYQSYDSNLNLNLHSARRVWAEGEIERVSQSWQNEVKKFKLDYVVITPEEAQIASGDNSVLIKKAQFGNYKIYKYEQK